MYLPGKHTFVAAIVTTGLGLGSAFTGAHAQNSGGGPIDNQQLALYAEAAVEVSKIRQTYLPKIENTQDPKESAALREEATSKMVNSINEIGISVDDYNRITKRLREDPELAEHVNKMIKDTQ